MKLFDGGRGPNPPRPRNLLAVKGSTGPPPQIDLCRLQQKSGDFTAIKPRVLEFISMLDRELKQKRFVAGDALSVADITGLVSVDFMKPAKLAVPDEFQNLKRWHADLSARPSASA